MIKFGSTCCTCENSSSVCLKYFLIGLNGNGNGVFIECRFHLTDRHLFNIGKSINSTNTLWSIISTVTHLPTSWCVWVSILCHKRVRLSIHECQLHCTSITCVVLCRAFNKIFLWKWCEWSKLIDFSDSLNGSSSREWPARSTLSLVFNSGNSTRLYPVDWRSQVVGGKVFIGCLKLYWRSVTKHLLIFLISVIHQVVHFGSMAGVISSVVFCDKLQIFLENITSHMEFFSCWILFSVFCHELHELVISWCHQMIVCF